MHNRKIITSLNDRKTTGTERQQFIGIAVQFVRNDISVSNGHSTVFREFVPDDENRLTQTSFSTWEWRI